MKRSLLVLLLIGLVGCGSTPTTNDETKNWSAQKIYAEAKDKLNSGSYDKSIKLFETLEARYPYGRYAQQAQLEVAYAYYKDNEPVSAVAACDRFIKLHPNSPNVDYAYYLKGLANFTEDQSLFARIADQDMTERDPRSASNSFEIKSPWLRFRMSILWHFPFISTLPSAWHNIFIDGALIFSATFPSL